LGERFGRSIRMEGIDTYFYEGESCTPLMFALW
jgi:hypothetical protein